jgi:hypothetical protein
LAIPSRDIARDLTHRPPASIERTDDGSNQQMIGLQ